MTTIFYLLAYVWVSWSNVQKFLTMTMAKILKFPWSNGQNWPFLTMTIDRGKNFKITMVKWSKLVNFDH